MYGTKAGSAFPGLVFLEQAALVLAAEAGMTDSSGGLIDTYYDRLIQAFDTSLLHVTLPCSPSLFPTLQEFNKKVDDSEAARLLGEAKLHQSAISKAEANKDREQVSICYMG